MEIELKVRLTVDPSQLVGRVDSQLRPPTRATIGQSIEEFIEWELGKQRGIYNVKAMAL